MWKVVAGVFGLVLWAVVGDIGWLTAALLFGFWLDGRARWQALEARLAALEGAPRVESTLKTPAVPTQAIAESPLPTPVADVPPPPVSAVAPAQAESPSVVEVPAPAQVAAPAPLTKPVAMPVSAPRTGPGPFEQAWDAARAWLFGGNTVVRIGILILFFGVGFLIKYAADHSLLPIELRLAGVAFGAIALLVTGWRLVERRRGYALVLQGGGVGLLYLTAFGALKLYQLLPAAYAMALMVAFCGLSAWLAIRQDARSLAVMGSIGGFLAPILASTGSGNHVLLFSYYALLNAGIFAIAWFKAWRPLNLVGFVFTFGIGTAWGVQSYQPALFASTEPFLILFFAAYLAIAVLYALRQGPLRGAVDSTLVFGTPLVGFGLQAALVARYEFGLPYSAVALAAVYLGLAGWLLRRGEQGLRLLAETFIALGVIFATLAIPLALDARWTSAAWAVEGAGAVWVALRQQRRVALWFGLALQLAAAVALAIDSPMPVDVAWLNHRCVGGVLLAVSWWFSAWRLQTVVRPLYRGLSIGFAALGLLAWLVAVLAEIERLQFILLPAGLWLAAATALLAWLAHERLNWRDARWPALLLPLALGWIALVDGLNVLDRYDPAWWQPLRGWALLAWPVALLVAWWLQRRLAEPALVTLQQVLHVVLAVLLPLLLAFQVAGWVSAWQPQGDWAAASWAAVLAAVVLALRGPLRQREGWPWQPFQAAYSEWAAGGLALLIVIWTLPAASWSAAMAPLPYLPLFNPLDLVTILAGFALWRCLPLLPERRVGWALFAGLAFIWLNAVLLRTLHHWAQVPWQVDALAHSTLVHATLSLCWTVLALAVMVLAHRRAWRVVWFVGAGLLAVVVVKLFLVDLSQLSGVTRIVSFLGVGLLLLLIGYVSPLPPAREESA